MTKPRKTFFEAIGFFSDAFDLISLVVGALRIICQAVVFVFSLFGL